MVTLQWQAHRALSCSLRLIPEKPLFGLRIQTKPAIVITYTNHKARLHSNWLRGAHRSTARGPPGAGGHATLYGMTGGYTTSSFNQVTLVTRPKRVSLNNGREQCRQICSSATWECAPDKECLESSKSIIRTLVLPQVAGCIWQWIASDWLHSWASKGSSLMGSLWDDSAHFSS